jgi:hypothetical protein
MKKIYILIIAICLGGIVNAQNWEALGSDDFNQPSITGNNGYYNSFGINNSGIPFVFVSELNIGWSFPENTVRKFSLNKWINVGISGFTRTTYGFSSISFDVNGNPFVAFQDTLNNNHISVMKYDGSNWVIVGNPSFATGNLASLVLNNSGTPYIVYIDSSYNQKITVKKYDGITWVNVGNPGFSAGQANSISLVLNATGTPYVAYSDFANNSKATVKKFNGSNWVDVGNAGFSAGLVNYTSITIDANGFPYIVYQDSVNNNKATVKKFNGNSWVNVGNAGFSAGAVNYTTIVTDITGVPYVGYSDFLNNSKATVMKYNGSSWVNVGSLGNNTTFSNVLSIDQNGFLYMAFYENYYNNKRRYNVMKFNGNNWLYLGDRGISEVSSINISNAVDSSGITYIAYSDDADSMKASVKKFNGSSWVYVGYQGFSTSKAEYVSIAISPSGTPYVVYRETANGGKATVKKFNGNSWVNVGNSGLANGFATESTSIAIDSSGTPYVAYTEYTTGNRRAYVEKYNGSNWVTVGNNFASDTYYKGLNPQIAINNSGTPYIIYNNGEAYANKKLVCKKFNGSFWELIGNSNFSYAGGYKNSIAIDENGTSYIAYVSLDSGLMVKKNIGNNWINVGNVLNNTFGGINYLKIAIGNNGNPYISYVDITNSTDNVSKGIVKKFNGSSWENVGLNNITAGIAYCLSFTIDKNNFLYVAYGSCGFSWVKKFSQCINPTIGGVVSANQSICLGSTPVMLSNTQNSSGFMGSQVYRWQKSTISDTSGFSDIAGATGLTYQPPSLNVNTWFRRLANVSCSNNWIDSAAISNVIKIKIDSFPVTATAAAISGSTSVCQGQTNVAYTVPAIANASSYIWSLPSGATTTNTTNTIYVNYGSSAVSGNITVKGHSSCGDGGSSSLAIALSPLPAAAATITGLSSVCSGQSSVTYSIPAIPNVTSYMWTLPAGVIGTSTTNTITVNYGTSAVSGNISVCGVNSCGNGVSSIKAISVILPVAAAGSITGLTTVCQDQTAYYTIPAIANATSYSWTLPTGATGSSTSNAINVTYGTSAVSGNITVKGLNSCGNGPSSTLGITVNPKPATPSSIIGLASVCAGQNSVTYTVSPIANADSYFWTIPTGVTGTSITNTISLNFGMSLISGYVSVKGHNACGYGVNSSSLAVTVNPFPAAAATITGLSLVCPGQSSVTYSIPAIANATSYMWTLPAGATGTSTTNTITVNYGSSVVSGTISVYGINSCGNGTPSNKAITVTSTPDAAGSISGATAVCPNQTSVIYTVPVIARASSYIWSLPSGATGNSTTNTITVNYGTSAAAGNITVKGSNVCGIGDSSILAVTVNVSPGAAGIISGITTVCQGQNLITYTTPAIANATSYAWTLPPGFTGSGANNSITVNIGNYAISSNITVKGINACGAGIPSSLFVNVNPLPLSSGFISGTTNVCKGQTYTYSVSPIANATSYSWTLPTGVIGTSDSNSINGYFGLSASNGNITVKGNNSCGVGATSSIGIYVNPTPSAAGNITGLTNVCQGQNSIIYSVPPIANASSYEWTLPSGVIGTSLTDTISVNYSISAISGSIIVKGSNSNCYGDSSSLAVTLNPSPSTASSITGTSNVTAAQQNVQYSIPAIANATSYLWLLPNGASGTSTTNTITVNYSSSAVSGNITVKGVNLCGNGLESSLYITVNPFIPNCSAQFDLVADTAVLHHYFVVNNASGVPPLQYNWSWGDGTFSTTAYPTHTYSAAGYYNICLSITDSVGCTVSYCDSSYLQKNPNAIISVQVIPQGSLGISNLSTEKIKIYPNPAKDNLIIELIRNIDLRNNTISFYNIAGQLIKQLSTKQTKTEIDIHDFPAGVYVVKVNNEKESFISKFVKE